MSALHHHAAGVHYVNALHAGRAATAARRRGAPAGDDLERLVAGAAAGDRVAWDELVARFHPMLLRVARAHDLNRQEAEDAVQDTWIRLMGSIGRVREPRALAGWLTTTVRRESLRMLQRGRREKPTGDELWDELPDGADDEVDLDADACRTEVTRAISLLPPRHSQLMRALFAEDECSYEEIAARLGIPVGSIGPIRGRCLAKLRVDARLREAAGVLD
jgi:RNA polymerase sigma factor (sigma-70 family)